MNIRLVAMEMEAKGQKVPVLLRSSSDKGEKSKHHECDKAGKVAPCGPHHCGHCDGHAA